MNSFEAKGLAIRDFLRLFHKFCQNSQCCFIIRIVGTVVFYYSFNLSIAFPIFHFLAIKDFKIEHCNRLETDQGFHLWFLLYFAGGQFQSLWQW